MNLEASIRKCVDKKGLKMDFVYNSISMTPSGFYKMLRTNSIKVEVLEKIAKVLNVPERYFFATEEEQDKLLKGDEDNLWLVLATAAAVFGSMYLYTSTLNGIHGVVDKIKEDSNYSRDLIEADLIKIQTSMKDFIQLMDTFNSVMEPAKTLKVNIDPTGK